MKIKDFWKSEIQIESSILQLPTFWIWRVVQRIKKYWLQYKIKRNERQKQKNNTRSS